MSLADAIRREFMERLESWLRAERPELWNDSGGELANATMALAALEGGRVYGRDLDNGGRLWLVVGGERIIGVEWLYGAFGKLEELHWWGYDPGEPQKSAGRNSGGRRYHPQTGEILN